MLFPRASSWPPNTQFLCVRYSCSYAVSRRMASLYSSSGSAPTSRAFLSAAILASVCHLGSFWLPAAASEAPAGEAAAALGLSCSCGLSFPPKMRSQLLA